MGPKRTRAAVAKEEQLAERKEERGRKKSNELVRTRSIDSANPSGLLRNGSFTSLFKKRARKGLLDEDEGNATDNNRNELEDSDLETVAKRAKIMTKAQEQFEKQEAVYDSQLPEEFRKYRPKGFSFNLPPQDRPIRIYADGVFDLFHLGHMRQLEQCKKAFENVTLVVGIPSDAETHKRKGLTVLTDTQRYASLRHCRWVDEVVEDAPWIVQMNFLKKHKIDYVAHDDLPYVSAESDDIYKPMKEAGMFLATQRTEGISTSDIITKIIRDYDKYLMRNFARGATRKELNVSWLKKNELDLKRQVNDFRGYFKKANDNLNTTSRDLYFEVREYLRGKNDRSRWEKSHDSPITSQRSSFERGTSPASEFASKYNGNKGVPLTRTKSLIDNFKEWMKRGGDLELETSSTSSLEGEDDAVSSRRDDSIDPSSEADSEQSEH